MSEAINSLYEELLREARQYRVPNFVLFRFHKKMEKVKNGKEDVSKVIIPLIREIEKHSQGGNRESVLDSMRRKRDRFSELRKEEIYKGK